MATGSVFGAIDGGYAVLVDELVRRAGIRWVQVAVERVSRSQRGWEIVDDEGGRHYADATVLAVPAPRLARLVEEVAPRTAAAARRIGVASSALVALALPGGTPLARAVRCAGRRGRTVARQGDNAVDRESGAGAATSSWCGCRTAGSATTWPRRAGDEDLLAWAAQDLATVFGVAVEPEDCHVQRWLDAMPQYGPGHGELVAELRAGLPPTLAVAGAYLDGIGVPACVARPPRAAAVAESPARVAR